MATIPIPGTIVQFFPADHVRGAHFLTAVVLRSEAAGDRVVSDLRVGDEEQVITAVPAATHDQDAAVLPEELRGRGWFRTFAADREEILRFRARIDVPVPEVTAPAIAATLAIIDAGISAGEGTPEWDCAAGEVAVRTWATQADPR